MISERDKEERDRLTERREERKNGKRDRRERRERRIVKGAMASVTCLSDLEVAITTLVAKIFERDRT